MKLANKWTVAFLAYFAGVLALEIAFPGWDWHSIGRIFFTTAVILAFAMIYHITWAIRRRIDRMEEDFNAAMARLEGDLD